jgi:hypothetical protein
MAVAWYRRTFNRAIAPGVAVVECYITTANKNRYSRARMPMALAAAIPRFLAALAKTKNPRVAVEIVWPDFIDTLSGELEAGAKRNIQLRQGADGSGI